jgi:hypothetical protein
VVEVDTFAGDSSGRSRPDDEMVWFDEEIAQISTFAK